MSDQAVQEIGRYRIEGEIGRGAMAIVHLAHQPDLDRAVALKQLSPFWATDPIATARFLREARLAGSLNHPNILIVHEYFEHGGVPYIAMEYLPRGPLRSLVGALTDTQVVAVLDGILAGLAHADAHGIVHRDLKPENVMRTDDGTVKIADFGIATAYDELANANLTPLDQFVGAPGYVSPEQVLGKEATPRSDLYSVGVVAFELFTGSVPFASAGAGGTLLIRKVNKRPPRLASLRPDLPRRIAEWVDRLLERDPARRPASALVARETLEDAAEAAFGGRWRRNALLPPGSPAPTRPPTGSPGRRASVGHALTRPLNLFVAAVVSLAAVATDSWLFPVAACAYLALAVISYFESGDVSRSARDTRHPERF